MTVSLVLGFLIYEIKTKILDLPHRGDLEWASNNLMTSTRHLKLSNTDSLVPKAAHAPMFLILVKTIPLTTVIYARNTIFSLTEGCL